MPSTKAGWAAMLAAGLALAGVVTASFAAQGAAASAVTLSEAIASQVGRWNGKLEYRDYQADQWFGLPVSVEVRDGGDGVTQIRVADFDDGPKTGFVRITTVSMIGADGVSEYSVGFRKGREPELSTARLALTQALDDTHWTIVAEEDGMDDDRPARIRSTAVRDGDTLVTLKEVDFTDDDNDNWLMRNRTTLKWAVE